MLLKEYWIHQLFDNKFCKDVLTTCDCNSKLNRLKLDIPYFRTSSNDCLSFFYYSKTKVLARLFLRYRRDSIFRSKFAFYSKNFWCNANVLKVMFLHEVI